uniref:ATP synthase F0 subunit 6 n=1 Tax=Ambigolimax valentianus TaxID=1338344 RepID=UPI0024112C1E|nr:ATP synthase F0 subunit 6 [Ambigolimax valentianus]WEI33081.1 ATP synthase F0 subunit 6 [Ambigolimax valentianus]
MMADLFSSLDGMHSFTSWSASIIFIYLYMTNSTWLNFMSTFINKMLFSFWKGPENFLPLKLFLSALMLFMILNNLIGLTPFTYGVTSSLWFNSSFAVILWFSLMLSGWTFNTKKSVAHLTPAGAPTILVPFLIIIESISIIIRPLTLTVRLVANISAGHIVLSLVANVLSASLPFLSQSLMVFLMIGYVLFELFVCLIQAYIFTLLISLYATEHP